MPNEETDPEAPEAPGEETSLEAETPKRPVRKKKVRKKRSGAKRQAPKASTKTKILPTSRIAFPRQIDLLRAYANVNAGSREPVTNTRAAEIVGMSASTVSLANPFFADVGLVERVDGGYVPAPEVTAFARMYRWEPEKAPHELAPVLRESWFAKILLPRLAYSSLTEREAIAELDKEATAGPDYLPQLRMLIDYLGVAGLVHRDGDVIEPGDLDSRRAQTATEPEPEFRPSPEPATGHHPLIQGLLRELPPAGSSWTTAKRDRWLQLAKLTVEMLYETEDQAAAPPTKEPDVPDMPR